MHLLFTIILGLAQAEAVIGQCFGDPAMDAEFAGIITGDETATEIPIDGSCCQKEVCGLPCAEEVPPPPRGYAISLFVAIIIFVLVGFASVFVIKGKNENYFVAGRSLNLYVVTATLASQSIDANALLGNVTLSYKYHFWDGACLPVGLGLSLILNAVFLAHHINMDHALTLPDVFGKRYGKLVEIMVSVCTICSFICLLAGNLVGMGVILNYILFDDTQESLAGAVALSAIIVLVYTVAGGLFSVAYTDCLQALIGWTGCCALAFYLIKNEKTNASPPSIGFPGYIYPDDDTCQMYEGVPCTNDATLCCYNAAKWCPDDENCKADNGAYPFGDQRIFHNQMTDAHSLTPFPNAIVFNWATIFVLAFGNLAALDFQARCMASKTPKIATIGCVIAGCLTFIVGIPWSYLGALTRVYYGPDSARASFETDSCHTGLGLPTCALWLPDENAFIKLLTNEVPAFLGAWALIGIVAASMSTCDGAILAMGTVFSHNIMRNLGSVIPRFPKKLVHEKNLLLWARIVSVPFAIAAMLIAMLSKPRHSLGVGYLLVVAFDIVLASVVVPLFGCFYTDHPSPLAAFCAIITGALVRVILEFSLPKDGWVLAPFPGPEFVDYGAAASSLFPAFFDEDPSLHWDPAAETCEAPRFEDWTGVDSLAAPIAGLIAFVIVQYCERDAPLIKFDPDGIMAPYMKEFQEREWKFQMSQRNPKLSQRYLAQSSRAFRTGASSIPDSTHDAGEAIKGVEEESSVRFETPKEIKADSDVDAEGTQGGSAEGGTEKATGGDGGSEGATNNTVEGGDDGYKEFQAILNSQ